MKRKKREAVPEGTDRMATLARTDQVARKVRNLCNNLKRRSEWELDDLATFVNKVGESVGVDMAPKPADAQG